VQRRRASAAADGLLMKIASEVFLLLNITGELPVSR
jgi:hypothetical protein